MQFFTILSALTAIAMVAASPVTPSARLEESRCLAICRYRESVCAAALDPNEIDLGGWYVPNTTVIVHIQGADTRAVALSTA